MSGACWASGNERRRRHDGFYSLSAGGAGDCALHADARSAMNDVDAAVIRLKEALAISEWHFGDAFEELMDTTCIKESWNDYFE